MLDLQRESRSLWSRATLFLALTWCLLPGCEGSTKRGDERDVPLVVLVASSLADVARALVESASSDQGQVQVSAMGSQAARLQIVHGAKVDCFVSADRAQVDALESAGLLQHREVVAHNALALIVPSTEGSPVVDLGTLPSARRLVMGTENSPIGAYSRELLRRAETDGEAGFFARTMAKVVSLETNVRLVLAKVELGEADAAFVYRTDAVGRAVRTLPIAEHLNPTVTYELAITKGATAANGARCRALFTDVAATKVLRAHGFVVLNSSRANVPTSD